MERDELIKHLGMGPRLAKIKAAEMDCTDSNDLHGPISKQVTGKVTEHPAKLRWVVQGQTDRAERLALTGLAAGYLRRVTPDKPIESHQTELPKLSRQTHLKPFIQ